ncbi:uncharacterized protein LOC128391272 [Panonychus citri]|uniref:uncharacterized protein LOC128391272 n=1 Tax=Panonychus citri TaxID=50023 RepID=UPI002307311C|nr:uncharacterized protein LOC128391272 [Panonychus citri]
MVTFVVFSSLYLSSCKSHVVVKDSTGVIDGFKKKAEMAGMVSGASVGFGKAILKSKIQEPVVKEIYTQVKPKKPVLKVKWVEEVRPVLVRVNEEPKTVYKKKIIKSTKKTSIFKAGVLPYVKGFFKGKWAAKSVSKVLKH